MEKVYAQIKFSTGDKVNLELYPEIAPISVANFVKLAESNYYRGAIFHRVIDNFMIQTGGYYVDEEMALGELPEIEPIKGEFASNGIKNDLKHTLGVISMARTSDKNSATSQFFLCSTNCSWLDGEYAAFGKTTDEESNKTILKISKVETCVPHPAFQNFPVEIIAIEEVLIGKAPFGA